MDELVTSLEIHMFYLVGQCSGILTPLQCLVCLGGGSTIAGCNNILIMSCPDPGPNDWTEHEDSIPD
jgi:hypothetical protein